MNSLLVTLTQAYYKPSRGQRVKGLHLSAGSGAAATLELFDGAIGIIATVTVGNAGVATYVVGDVLTLVGGDNTATVTVATLSAGTVATVTLTTPGTGYVNGSTYATTGGGGTGATITVASLAANKGVSVGKLECAQATSANPLQWDAEGLHMDNGVYALLTGAGAQGYIYYQ